ncbi:squalene--hopene cyclase [Tuwongella immobilis]|uniref:squalene--hopene cyclase n=1 Tax=Tuwongella immobilis TaxID=692036 RepID=UPI0013A69F6A|nr:squalene--hopene cyclase [Tuwongella immobilis]
MTAPNLSMPTFVGSADDSSSTLPLSLNEAIEAAANALIQLQRADGHWVSELEGDTILESEYILLMAFLRREDDETVQLAANYLLENQLDDGGWGNFPGGGSDISVSVKAYFALKIAGYPASDPRMMRAAKQILKLGGAEATNSFTRFYLAILGQFPFENCAAVPPEMILLPRWFRINIYAMSSWSRTIFVPLSVVWSLKPVRRLPEENGIRELFRQDPYSPRYPCAPTKSWLSWTNFFLGVDAAIKWCEKRGFLPFRKWATKRAIQWMEEHSEKSDGIGAIFPPIVYTCIVYHAMGKSDSPEFEWAMEKLRELMIREGNTLRLQPCLSPVWDTALSTIALADANIDRSHDSMDFSCNWLIRREITFSGDWAKTVYDTQPGGWCFEYENAFYPDTDDTAMVLMALSRAKHLERHEAQPAVQRGLAWLRAMQNQDGGWAAFDRDITLELLERVPFADHNAMLDPSCPDITARVLEAFGHYGFHVGDPIVDRGIAFIRTHQQKNGSWLGRWGVNYLYGTWQVLQGLRAVGFSMHEPMIQRAVEWLKQVQNSDGGWGETCASYDDPTLAGIGESTASQTAWAILGLLAADEVHSPEVNAGIDYLLRTQQPDGAWSEIPFTGTGFPKVFYLKYHLYPHYFPLMALGRYAKLNQA